MGLSDTWCSGNGCDIPWGRVPREVVTRSIWRDSMLLQEHQRGDRLKTHSQMLAILTSSRDNPAQHSTEDGPRKIRSEGVRGGRSPVIIFPPFPLPLPLFPYCTVFWFSCRIGLSFRWAHIAQDRGPVPGERCSHTTHKAALLMASRVNMATKIYGTCFNTSIGMLFVPLQCQPIYSSRDTLNDSAQQEP